MTKSVRSSIHNPQFARRLLLYSPFRISYFACVLCLVSACVLLLPSRGWTHLALEGTNNIPGAQCTEIGPEPGNPDGEDGDPVDLGTGLFVYRKTDLSLSDVIPIALTRIYRQDDIFSRPFGLGTTHPYELFLVGDQYAYTYAELILPDGGRIRYNRISLGTDHVDAVMEHTATPTRFYKSTLSYKTTYHQGYFYVLGGWDLKLKDGTVYQFKEYRVLEGEQFFIRVRLASIQDRYGNTLTVTRDSKARITKITSPHSRWLEFTYDAANRITQARDNSGRAVLYAYDTDGRLVQVTDPAGGVTQYTYDNSVPNEIRVKTQMLTIKEAWGNVFLTNEYLFAQVGKQTLADGSTYRFTYLPTLNGKETFVINPRGVVRRVAFNASGYIVSDTRALGTPEEQTITYERQAGTNLVLAEIDPLGRKTVYTYDAMGNVTSMTRLAGTPDATTISLTYEPTFNQIQSITDPLGHITSFTYNSKGSVLTVTDPLGKQTSLTYNAAGQPTTITAPLGNTTTFTYAQGDLVAVTDPLGNTTQRTLDSIGRLLRLTTPLGQSTRYAYDSLNRLTSVTDALGGQTAFTYDPNSNMLSVTDAKAHTTSYSYDNRNRLTSRTDPLGRVENYEHDAAGNLTKFTDRKEQETTYAYDVRNRRTLATYADASTIVYSYDKGDRLTRLVDSLSGTITRSYDGLDRLLSEETRQGTVSYSYDQADRRTALTVTGQSPVAYLYDNAHRLTQIDQGMAAVTFAYDDAGRRTRLTLPNGVVVDYGYDAASRLTSLTYKLGENVLGDLTYGYDKVGHRTQVGGSFARADLPHAVASTTYNAANQQLTFGDKTLEYDLNGNLISLSKPSGATTLVWDARNRLTALLNPQSITLAAFQYDGLGRRIVKSVNGASTEYLYDGRNIVQESLGALVQANLLTGLEVDEVFSRTDSAGDRYFLPDALGSTVGLTDSAGSLQTEYTYTPFGETTVSGTINTNPFQYTGRENDGTTELYYYRARYYYPMLQRFISEDPIGFAGGDTNLYGYVSNNPVNFIDSHGLAKGAKEKMQVGDFNKKSSQKAVEEAIEKAITKGQIGHAKKLQGLLKVIKRGGAMSLIGILINEMLFPPELNAGEFDDVSEPTQPEDSLEPPSQPESSNQCPSGGLAPTADPKIIDLGFQPTLR